MSRQPIAGPSYWLLPGSQRLPGGLSPSPIGCRGQLGHVSRFDFGLVSEGAVKVARSAPRRGSTFTASGSAHWIEVRRSAGPWMQALVGPRKLSLGISQNGPMSSSSSDSISARLQGRLPNDELWPRLDPIGRRRFRRRGKDRSPKDQSNWTTRRLNVAKIRLCALSFFHKGCREVRWIPHTRRKRAAPRTPASACHSEGW